MSRVLSPENRVGSSHFTLYQRVPNLGANGFSAGSPNGLLNNARGEQIVNHRNAGFASSLGASDFSLGNDGANDRRAHYRPGFINHKAAIGITIKGKTEVGTLRHHGSLKVA